MNLPKLWPTLAHVARGGVLVALSDPEQPSHAIEGGTSNILRNALAEQVRGRPREPGPDKGMRLSAALR